jgi:hypothetical protein
MRAIRDVAQALDRRRDLFEQRQRVTWAAKNIEMRNLIKARSQRLEKLITLFKRCSKGVPLRLKIGALAFRQHSCQPRPAGIQGRLL